MVRQPDDAVECLDCGSTKHSGRVLTDVIDDRQEQSGAYCEVCHKQLHTKKRLDIHTESTRHKENIVFAEIIQLYEQRRNSCSNSLMKR